MERSRGRDDAEAAAVGRIGPARMNLAVEPGKLDGRLIGVGAAVTEKDAAIEAAMPGDGGGGARLWLGVQQIPHVPELPRLFGDGFDQRGVAVAQDRRAEAGEQVEIFFAVGIPEATALAADHGDRITWQVHDHVAIVGVDDVLVSGGGAAAHDRLRGYPGGGGGGKAKGYHRPHVGGSGAVCGRITQVDVA